MSSQLRVSLLQLQSVDDVSENMSQIETLMKSVSSSSALVCLPENALYMRLCEGEKIEGFSLEDSCFEQFKSWAREKNLVFHLGSVPLKWMDKLTNSSVMVWPDGRIEASYQKIHLFDIELEGQKPIRESDVFRHGRDPQSFELNGWKWGQTICYDLRFAELFGYYAKAEMDALLVPSAFLKTTGEVHWHILLRARAIENQCYVIAAAQAGVHQSARGRRETYGHSLVVDPWGRILAEGSGDSPEVLEVTLDRTEIQKVRRQIPMRDHRRFS